MNAPAIAIRLLNPGPNTSLEIDLSRHEITLHKTTALGKSEDFGAQSAKATTRFTDNNDGTITDHRTGLMWSKATNSSKCINHAEAVKACADLDLAGHTDWRLPTRTELLSLVDDTRHAPAIDTDFFPDTKNDWYWTSTITAWSSGRAWIVGFSYGLASYGSLRGLSSAFARAVRVAGVPGQ